MLQVVVSLTIVILMTSGVIYDRHMFIVKATGVYLTVEHVKGASLRFDLALLPNIRLGWKDLLCGHHFKKFDSKSDIKETQV
jgi:hypothetical protein